MKRTEFKAKRDRKCKHCKKSYRPAMSTQAVCSIPCATELGKSMAEKVKKADTKKRKEQLKSRGQWAKEAQTQFNRWVRLRDHAQPCISCGRHHRGQYHAGHYRTVGAHPELRFEPWNVHKQCSACNNHLSGNIVEYRINLVERIGVDGVRFLEGPHEPKKYTIEELKEIKDFYRVQGNLLKKRIDDE